MNAGIGKGLAVFDAGHEQHVSGRFREVERVGPSRHLEGINWTRNMRHCIMLTSIMMKTSPRQVSFALTEEEIFDAVGGRLVKPPFTAENILAGIINAGGGPDGSPPVLFTHDLKVDISRRRMLP